MTYVEYPAYRWNADGELFLVNDISEDLPGLFRTHPANPILLEQTTVEQFDKDRVMALLAEGGVVFDSKMSLKKLKDLLADELKTAMTARGIAYQTDATVEDLYATAVTGPV